MNEVNEKSATLIAHCGTRKISREELSEIPAPEGTRTHQPLAHFEVVSTLIESLSFRFLKVIRDEYAVSPDGMKMFGVMDLNSEFDGCRFSIGLRNSNDKSMRLALTAGARICVCDNMMFSGDFNPLFHKHTRNLALSDAIALAVDRIHRNFLPLQAKVSEMKKINLSDEMSRVIIYNAFVDKKLRGLPRHLLPTVHEHYFKPEYEEFEARNLWSMSNAFTSAFKKLAPVKQFEITAWLGSFMTGVQEEITQSRELLFNLQKDELENFFTEELRETALPEREVQSQEQSAEISKDEVNLPDQSNHSDKSNPPRNLGINIQPNGFVSGFIGCDEDDIAEDREFENEFDEYFDEEEALETIDEMMEEYERKAA